MNIGPRGLLAPLVLAASASAAGCSQGALTDADRRALAAEVARSPELTKAVAAEVARSPELRLAVTKALAAAVPVSIPVDATAEDVTTTLALTLAGPGDLYLDGRRATEEELRQAITSATRSGREVRGVVAADKAVPHARVLQILDLLRSSGVHRVAVNVEPGAELPPAPGAPEPIRAPRRPRPGEILRSYE